MIRNFFTSFPRGADTRRRKKVAWKNSYVEILGNFCLEKGIYCSASIRRVMVRFKSLSDRRISSILLMECSTVV
jgi:hypothetical protein